LDFAKSKLPKSWKKNLEAFPPHHFLPPPPPQQILILAPNSEFSAIGIVPPAILLSEESSPIPRAVRIWRNIAVDFLFGHPLKIIHLIFGGIDLHCSGFVLNHHKVKLP
jgi:hypothetical protein